MDDKPRKPDPEAAGDGKTPPAGKARAARPQGKDGPAPAKADEVGGPRGPDPTRYGDWERKGRCIDF